jgi:ubiquinone/menaquinone biosynthesis C-methylase UbiE
MTESTSNLLDRVSKANLAAYDAKGAEQYIDGAPHLKHASLRRLYAELLVEVFEVAKKHRDPPRVLDLGAGEGSVTLPLLELGANVTAVDLSSEMLSELQRKCSNFSDRLTVRNEDIETALRTIEGPFDIVTANSFLHHIPDYLSMLKGVIPILSPHGQLFTFQDPTKYSTQPGRHRLFDRVAYLSWRIGKADVWGGLQRHFRRSRGVFIQDSPHDNAEYHVLRNGVDQDAIKSLFEENGFDCRIVEYYSTQSRLFQPIGSSLGMKNTFAVISRRHPSI